MKGAKKWASSSLRVLTQDVLARLQAFRVSFTSPVASNLPGWKRGWDCEECMLRPVWQCVVVG